MNVDEMQFCSMPERGAIDAVFILEVCKMIILLKENKLYVCFVDIEKALGRVPKKVLELAMRKKGILEVFVRSVMSPYEGANTRIRVDSELSE